MKETSSPKYKYILASLLLLALALSGCSSGPVDPNKVTTERSKDDTKYFVKKGEMVIKEFPLDPNSDDVDSSYEVEFQDDKFAYVTFCPGGLGGYIIYGVCPIQLYTVNLATNEVVETSLRNRVRNYNGGSIDTFSPDKKEAVWLMLGKDNRGKIVFQNLRSGSERIFNLPQGFNEFGDVTYSPDGKMVAVALVTGKEFDNEVGAVYTVDVARGIMKLIEKTTKPGFYRIKGWKADGTVDYKVEYFN